MTWSKLIYIFSLSRPSFSWLVNASRVFAEAKGREQEEHALLDAGFLVLQGQEELVEVEAQEEADPVLD
jgi:hypothetical protein